MTAHDRIVQFLKQADGYVSGEDMSETLKISRAAVWKYIDHLRKDGYDITAVPHLGYQLISVPDKLLPQEIQFGLNTRIFGRNAVAFDSVGSTMDEAFRLGMEGAPEGTIVCAEAQSKGRGRLGRVWSSPKGKGIYCSLILRPRLPPGQLAQLTLTAAVALAEALRKTAGLELSIKWPNDILAGNKKLAGILTELRAETDRVQFVVVGMGINVNTPASQLVDGAASLRTAAGRNFNRVAVLQEILRSFELWYAVLGRGRFDEVIKAWKARSSTLKRRVRVTDPAGSVEGMAVDLDVDGGLLVRLDSGTIVKKTAGDVTALR